MIKFVNNSEPDITAENLNKMQQDIGTVVSATEPQGDERLKVWIQKGKNLFNKKNVVTGQLEGDGSITYTSQYYTSDFISINPETSYYKTSTNSARLKFYDKDKKPLTSKYDDIENANTSTEFVSPTNAYYLRLTLNPSYIDTLQIEQGTSSTSYEAYIEPKIYVLNNNGVYEELMKKEDISNELYYKSGDKFITSYGTYYGGTLTGSLKTISFTIPLPKSTKNIKNITINSIKITVRDVKGQYLLNGVTKDTFNGNFTIEKRTDYLYTIYLNSNTAFESINNTPVAVALDSIDLTFN